MKTYAACTPSGVIQYTVTTNVVPDNTPEFTFVEVSRDFDGTAHHFDAANNNIMPGSHPGMEAHTDTLDKSDLLTKITVLERGQYRAMRELLISLSTGTECSQKALDQLVEIDDQIVALRSKL
jgi:hypothetical protein